MAEVLVALVFVVYTYAWYRVGRWVERLARRDRLIRKRHRRYDYLKK